MEKRQALSVWLHEFGDKEYAYDFTGRKIKRDDYQVTNQVGWVVSYMRPLALGGSTDDGNTIIIHHFTDGEKGMDYPRFTVDEIPYRVVHDQKNDYYYIEKIDDYEDDETLN